MKKPLFLAAALIASAFAGWAGFRWTMPPASADRSIEVWKSQTCGCCTSWIAYLENEGYTVTVHDVDDVDPIKDKYGVPDELRSCHTGRIAGYAIEGHVPATAIAKVIAERPRGVEGIAVPGMPPGAPGMDEDDSPYPVVTFGAGKTSLLHLDQ